MTAKGATSIVLHPLVGDGPRAKDVLVKIEAYRRLTRAKDFDTKRKEFER